MSKSLFGICKLPGNTNKTIVQPLMSSLGTDDFLWSCLYSTRFLLFQRHRPSFLTIFDAIFGKQSRLFSGKGLVGRPFCEAISAHTLKPDLCSIFQELGFRKTERGTGGTFSRMNGNVKKTSYGIEMAEREGFEPSKQVSPFTRLAGERLQPARPSLRNFST